MTNLQIAQLFRKVSAAYQILGENRFKIMAYDRAADSIEHLAHEVKDYWTDGKLGDIPGVGPGIAQHLDDLFKTGKVPYIEAILEKVPSAVFPLLLVPGLGPKKAFKLVTILDLKDEKTVVAELEKAISEHKVAEIEGFGEKSEQVILEGLEAYKKGQIKENRIILSEADAIANAIVDFLKDMPEVEKIDTMGSLRRKVTTIGDIDIAVATKDPEPVIEKFLTYPYQKLIEKGPAGASILLHNGKQVDLRVQDPKLYGAMLQYFTGSKNHNITLRSYALEHGMSLNEYGIKDVKTGKIKHYPTEEAFYQAIGMPWIPPEMREDHGEIPLALEDKLPHLVETKNIKGDFHIHTSYDLKPSHDLGTSSLEEYLTKAERYGYEYIGIADHNPSVSQHSEKEICTIMEARKKYYEHIISSYNKKSKKSIRVFIMCEIDILTDGTLALPQSAFAFLDAAIVSIHSGFSQDRATITKRIIDGLTAHPKVRIFGHPTARLVGKRDSIDAQWSEIFAICKERDVALEINASPYRLDLPDYLVFDAKNLGLHFSIDTDAHAVDQMDMMQYGVSVARRGWLTPSDIVDTWEYTKCNTWMMRA